MSETPVPARPPGLDRPRRFRPRLAYELLGCGLNGHALIGTDTAEVGPEDALVVREYDGLRWYRCLRCDSWLPLAPPSHPDRAHLPPREAIEVPLRGRPLRDRFVLRLIALDRVIHFFLIGAVAVALFLFAHDRDRLRGSWTRILNRLQGATGGPLTDTRHGLLHDLDRLFTVSSGKLLLYGTIIAVYAAVNLVEAVGLWSARRWAEYLAVVEVVVLVPVEVHELTVRVSPLKIVTLVLNLAVVAYLLVAHRLFGLRGGGRAAEAERAADTGWAALERSGLGPVGTTPDRPDGSPDGPEASPDGSDGSPDRSDGSPDGPGASPDGSPGPPGPSPEAAASSPDPGGLTPGGPTPSPEKTDPPSGRSVAPSAGNVGGVV